MGAITTGGNNWHSTEAIVTTDLTSEEIAELTALESGASPKTWHASDYMDCGEWGLLSSENVLLIRSLGRASESDLRLIAALRNAAPQLIAMARRTAELERADAMLRELRTGRIADLERRLASAISLIDELRAWADENEEINATVQECWDIQRQSLDATQPEPEEG